MKYIIREGRLEDFEIEKRKGELLGKAKDMRTLVKPLSEAINHMIKHPTQETAVEVIFTRLADIGKIVLECQAIHASSNRGG